jgi:hypothetical protein
MNAFRPELRALAAGSLPHTDPVVACRLVLDTMPEIPCWPQLPRRSFLENMYVQYSERFPGVVLEEERILVDRDRDLDPELETLYLASLENDLEFAAVSPDHAAGLHHFMAMNLGQPLAVKGQVTGPVSWGLVVTDQNRRPVLYEEVLAEAIATHLQLKAAWMERELRKLWPTSILFVDEPYMASFGSAFVSLGREQAISLIEQVFSGVEGLKAVHCCGNTDWSVLLSTSVDILNLDAYGYAETLALYPDEVGAFLERGGIIAWGIVPASDRVWDESVDSLVERFHDALGLLVVKGLHRDDLLARSLIMPSCGCGSLLVETAERVMALTADVSRALRTRYA